MSGPVGAAPPTVSARRRREIIDALRRGTVPVHGLDLFAVGVDRFAAALDADLDTAAGGGSGFKAMYGTGKTFLARWLAERALRRGFAAAEVQVSERETPLHRLDTIYRRVARRCAPRRTRRVRCGRSWTGGCSPSSRTRPRPATRTR